ncbi:hypothetical protein L798_08944 [Zootermopsis nevadensis]|uniref:Uncharacterized protein n=1 Tax=Zootermopsis nevadensis TaxID=136037 RepID=A0A067R2U0_ZOONE|nr:hypothetical protein L798_08944 [Zootermopsis nevadensis]
MRTEINPHGSYIILASGACQEFNKFTEHISKQLAGLTERDSWNPRARFVVPVMNACPHYNTTYLSRAILNQLWLHKVTNSVVLFSESKDQATKLTQQHETNSAQDTQCSLHTWLPYENSERCNPIEGTVPLKILSARNLNDVRNGGIFRGNFGKNLNRCPIKVLLREGYPYVVSQLIWNKTSGT